MTEIAPRISNTDFLELWRRNGYYEAILAQEAALIEERLEAIQAMSRVVIEQKKAVSGGDDWHDGAFRATDAEALRLSQQAADMSTKLSLPHVEMPYAESDVVSIGSRALVSHNSSTYDIDVVGYGILHSGDEEIATLASPIGRHIVGRQVGEIYFLEIGRRRHEFEIKATEPNPDLIEKH